MKFIVQSLLIIAALLPLQSAFAQEQAGACHTKSAVETFVPYTMTFNDKVALTQNQENKNFSLRLTSGRQFGCVIFSKVGELQGTYKALVAERLTAQVAKEGCGSKQDYEYAQFVDENNEKVFRLQCDNAVYEDHRVEPKAAGRATAATLVDNNPEVLKGAVVR